jgi:ATP-dependent Clp protease ATP-binding subunit ClpB
VLFDEIEKAHPDVFNILLQVLDDGRLTDNKGRVVNFKNTIIIMTSNLGSAYIQQALNNATSSGMEVDAYFDQHEDEVKADVMGLLKQTIRPEFLNRIDDIILFHPLSETDIQQIVRLQTQQISKRLEAQGVKLVIDESAIRLIAHEGYDPNFGARPVKRALQRILLNQLSHALLAGTVNKEKPILVKEHENHLIFEQSE